MSKYLSALPLLGFLSITSGCIYYENDCGEDEWGCEFDEDWADEDTAIEDGDEAEPAVLKFVPGHAEQGETFAGILSLESGELDLSEATMVFYGDVEVMAQVVEGDQITSILSVPEDAELGPVDAVLEFASGDAELLPGAFTIYPTGSGNSGTDWGGSSDGIGSADGECE